MNKILKFLFDFFASLKLAVIVLLSLAVVLIVGSIFESKFGTEVAQFLIYKTTWFSLLLVFLGINVACAALSRYPWQKKHIGFVTVHCGIIILLLGSLTTQKLGIDGSMPVNEGSQESNILLNEKTLQVKNLTTNETKIVPLPFGPFPKTGKNIFHLELDKETSLEINRYYPHAYVKERITETKEGPSAIQFQIFNDQMNMSEWIVPQNKDSLNLGPAKVESTILKTEKEIKDFLGRPGHLRDSYFLGKLTLTLFHPHPDPREREIIWALKLEQKHLRRWIKIENTPFEINISRFLPHAIVEAGVLTNKSKNPVNPALEFQIRGGEGIEKHTVFSNFPDFPTIHGKKESGNHVKAHYEFEQDKNAKLILALAESKKIYYKVLSSSGNTTQKGVLIPQKTYPLGWMNLKLKISQFLPHSEKTRYFEQVEVAPNESGPPSAVEVHVTHNTQTKKAWLGLGDDLKLENFQISYLPKTIPLPFAIELNKFELGFDPGTENPASFKSYVTIKDPSNNLHDKKEIYMNNPLNHKGFTFYQASYQMGSMFPTISIFSVNDDPGRFLKYLGTLCIVIGIILMFYFKRILRRNDKI